jgi:hypothetical protein
VLDRALRTGHTRDLDLDLRIVTETSRWNGSSGVDGIVTFELSVGGRCGGQVLGLPNLLPSLTARGGHFCRPLRLSYADRTVSSSLVRSRACSL